MPMPACDPCCGPTTCTRCPEFQQHDEYKLTIAGVVPGSDAISCVNNINGDYILKTSYGYPTATKHNCSWTYCGTIGNCTFFGHTSPWCLFLTMTVDVSGNINIVETICGDATISGPPCCGFQTTDTCTGANTTWIFTPTPLTCDFTNQNIPFSSKFGALGFDFTGATFTLTAL